MRIRPTLQANSKLEQVMSHEVSLEEQSFRLNIELRRHQTY